jgi:hypothetical protein
VTIQPTGGSSNATFYNTHTYFNARIEVQSQVRILGGNLALEAPGSDGFPWLMGHNQFTGDCTMVWNGAEKLRLTRNAALFASSFNTMSPLPPKPERDMRARDWLSWGTGQSKKPIWNKEGKLAPGVDDPEVVEWAERDGIDPRVARERVIEKYRKDIGLIAIATSRWSDEMQSALASSMSFAEFKQKLLTV